MIKSLAQVVIQTKDLGEGEIEAVVATGSIDRHGEKISIAGLNTTRYLKNPVVQWAHDYEKPPIGKATKLWVEGNQLMARVKFAVQENPFAKTIYDLIAGKFLNAVSIGFIPLEMDGNTYTKSEMVEFSIVPVPANANALITARSLGIDTSLISTYTDVKVSYNLEDLLKKDPASLTVGEIAFLKEHLNDLTKEQVSKFSSVLKEDEPTDEEKKAQEAKIAQEEADKKEAETKKEELEARVKALQDDVQTLKNADPVVIKNISNPQSVNLNKGAQAPVSKEMKFLHFVIAAKTGDWSKYSEIVGKDAMNTVDDAGLLAPAEFVTEINRLEEQYGVAQRDAFVRTSASGAGIKYLLGADDVEIFDTAESGVKKSTKISYDSQTLLWRKFAAILPITDELTEDAAIDIWRDATERFARAYAKREDELVFTELSAGGNTQDGIIHNPGVNAIDVANLAAVTYDVLIDMILGVPTSASANGKFYLNRASLGIIMKMKDTQQHPLWIPNMASGAPGTILGRPYVETEVLTPAAEAESGEGFIVYGDLKNSTLAQRSALSVKMFDTGLVGDPDDTDQSTQINLMTQDAQAMRVVKRMNAICRFPAAFSVLSVGDLDS